MRDRIINLVMALVIGASGGYMYGVFDEDRRHRVEPSYVQPIVWKHDGDNNG